MNPDRLSELLRQRELVRTHLAWLDREIAAAAPPPDSPSPGPSAPREPGVTPRTGSAPAAPAGLPPPPEFAANLAGAPAAELYRPDPRAAAQSVKRGCFTVFALALLLLALTLAAVYFVGYRDRPLLFAPRDNTMTEKPAAPPAPVSPRK